MKVFEVFVQFTENFATDKQLKDFTKLLDYYMAVT